MTPETLLTAIADHAFGSAREFAKMPAAEQRKLFGAAVFGRKDVRWNARRQMVETRVRTISMDWDHQSYTLDEVAKLVAKGKMATKGYGAYTRGR